MLRRAVLALAAIESMIWLYLVVGGSHDALFFAKGYGQQAAQLAHLVFVLLVLPALILAALNRALGVAALLAGFGALAYGFDPWLRAMTLFDGISAAGLVRAGRRDPARRRMHRGCAGGAQAERLRFLERNDSGTAFDSLKTTTAVPH